MYYVVISKPTRPGDPPALENGSWHWDAESAEEELGDDRLAAYIIGKVQVELKCGPEQLTIERDDDDGQPRFVVRDVSSGDYVVSATVLYFPK
jgi:hypothetical protein